MCYYAIKILNQIIVCAQIGFIDVKNEKRSKTDRQTESPLTTDIIKHILTLVHKSSLGHVN